MNLIEQNAKIVLSMPNGMKALLFSWERAEDEYPTVRNIYMLNNGDVMWRVWSKFDDNTSGHFTNMWLEDGDIHAYRWDGGEYGINQENGFATPLRLLK